MTDYNRRVGDPQRGPTVDPNEPSTFGTHLAYISAEVHNLNTKVDALSQAIASLMSTLPVTYAQASTVAQLASRVDVLESARDRADGASPAHEQLTHDIADIRRQLDEAKGGQRWLWTAFVILTTLMGLSFTLFKLVHPV